MRRKYLWYKKNEAQREQKKKHRYVNVRGLLINTLLHAVGQKKIFLPSFTIQIYRTVEDNFLHSKPVTVGDTCQY